MPKKKQSNLLVETFFSNTKHEIVESEGKDPQWIISGVMAKADIPTLNKTIYSREVLNNTLKPLQERVKEGLVRMLMDHPEASLLSNGTPSLEKSAALMLEVSDVQEDGNVYYKAQILDNKNGDIIKSILKAGGKVGNSTRGYGSIKESEYPPHKGKYKVVGMDYELRTTDFVEDPAVVDTERSMKYENNNRSEEMKTIEELRTEFPGLIEAYEATFKSQIDELGKFKAMLESVIAQIKTVTPDNFKVIPESEIISEKETKISEMRQLLANALEENKSLNAKIVEFETSKKVLERDAHVSSLKASDPDFFKFKSLYEDLDKCSDKEEVQRVYEAKKRIADEFKKESSMAAPKTETKKAEEVKSELTEDQKQQLAVINAQRLAIHANPISVEDFLKKVK